MKRLFEVIIEKTIYVIADDEREAELEASTYEGEEVAIVASCNEVKDIAKVPEDYKDSLPYGGDWGDKEMTVREILTSPAPPAPFVDPPEQGRLDFPGGLKLT